MRSLKMTSEVLLRERQNALNGYVKLVIKGNNVLEEVLVLQNPLVDRGGL